MESRLKFVVSFASLILLISALPAFGQNSGKSYEVGIVYYAVGTEFKPLAKETVAMSGRANYSAKLRGAHAQIRIANGQAPVFKICSVDPSRFKLYRFKSETNSRSVVLMKSNVWIGGAKAVVQESEIPLTIKKADADCFSLAPNQPLESGGEFGFSPDGSMDSFMFGVGEIKDSKQHQ